MANQHPDSKLNSEQQARALVPERGVVSAKDGGSPIGVAAASSQHSMSPEERAEALMAARRLWNWGGENVGNPPGREGLLARALLDLEEQYGFLERDLTAERANAESLRQHDETMTKTATRLKEQYGTLREAAALIVECEDALTEDGYAYLVDAIKDGLGSNPASDSVEQHPAMDHRDVSGRLLYPASEPEDAA